MGLFEVNTPVDSAGDTLLHHAMKMNNPDLVKKLIEAGAAPATFNALLQNAIDIAVQYNAMPALKMLVSITRDLHKSYFHIM